MAYNQKYFLLRVKDVNEVYQMYHDKGYPATWIYRNHIKNVFHISKSTMDRYLGIPYKRDLERMGVKLKENET